VFLLDASGSIGGDNFKRVLAFIEDLAGKLEIDSGRIKFSLVTFSDRANVIFYLGQITDKDDLLEAIRKTPYTRGRTNTGDAIRVSVVNILKCYDMKLESKI
jgi:uncharacterized protein YegL